MVLCCFCSPVDHEDTILTTLSASPPSQARSRVVPADVPAGDSKRGQLLTSSQRIASNAGGSSKKGAAAAHAAGYQDTDLEELMASRSMLSGLFSKPSFSASVTGPTPAFTLASQSSKLGASSGAGGGAGSSFIGAKAAAASGNSFTSRLSGLGLGGSWKKPAAQKTAKKPLRGKAGGSSEGGDSGEEEEDGEGDGAGSEGEEGGSDGDGGATDDEGKRQAQAAIREHLKKVQPKRGILKKANTALDAAAGGDEEALMRIASALAGVSPFARPGFAPIVPSSGSNINNNSMRDVSTRAGGAATAATAPPFSLTPSTLSVGQVVLEAGGSVGGGGLVAAGGWVNDPDGVGAGAGVGPPGGSSAVAPSCDGGEAGGGSDAASKQLTRGVSCSLGSSGVSNAVRFMAGGSGAALRFKSGSASGGGGAGGPTAAAASSTSRLAAGSGMGGGYNDDGNGGGHPASVLASGGDAFAARSARFGSRLAPCIDEECGSETVVAARHLSLTSRQLRPPPPMAAAALLLPVAYSSCDAGTKIPPEAAPDFPFTTISATPALQPSPSAPMPAGPTSAVSASANSNAGSRARRNELTAAKREDILRSLPPGKSPMWYAHKLREILGTNEGDDDGASGGGDFAVPPAGSSGGGGGGFSKAPPPMRGPSRLFTGTGPGVTTQTTTGVGASVCGSPLLPLAPAAAGAPAIQGSAGGMPGVSSEASVHGVMAESSVHRRTTSRALLAAGPGSLRHMADPTSLTSAVGSTAGGRVKTTDMYGNGGSGGWDCYSPASPQPPPLPGSLLDTREDQDLGTPGSGASSPARFGSTGTAGSRLFPRRAVGGDPVNAATDGLGGGGGGGGSKSEALSRLRQASRLYDNLASITTASASTSAAIPARPLDTSQQFYARGLA
ncbi:hypothetical protein Agub_g8626 [Astrephomene gubernaculifera]|uniref:Uncharacterized protein n=1 Tax=Astrephomene gubernaculifera TaxID=47775 RepID=A0AAD3DTS5_9CHLO|nr:hypothetical protein Agub_g8626 [Astrephomene gubernaculifera]